MTRPIRMEVNCETGISSVIELTDEEIVLWEAEAEKNKIEQAKYETEIQAKEDAKIAAQAKLQALGLTLEEIAALS
jgi:hypothetical protein